MLLLFGLRLVEAPAQILETSSSFEKDMPTGGQANMPASSGVGPSSMVADDACLWENRRVASSLGGTGNGSSGCDVLIFVPLNTTANIIFSVASGMICLSDAQPA